MRSEAINLDVLKEKINNISNCDSSYIEEWVDSFLICKSDKQLKRFVDKHGGIDHIVKMTDIMKGSYRDLYINCSSYIILNYIKN